MAHYAFVDKNNIVVEVIVGRDETDLIDGVESWESHYETFRKNLKCIRTSYNGNIRKNFAGIGFSYDSNLDAFIPPKCHNEATLDDTANWICSNKDHDITKEEVE